MTYFGCHVLRILSLLYAFKIWSQNCIHFCTKSTEIFEGKRRKRKHGKEIQQKYNSETGKNAFYVSIPSPVWSADCLQQ
jgi:hypothetical protein